MADLMDRWLREVHYNLLRLSRNALRDKGLTPPRYHVLSHVVRHGEMDMGTLHKAMPVTKSSVTSLVDGLVEDELLSRDRSNKDRRRVVLRATERGEALLESLRAARCSHLNAALQDIEPGDQSVTRDTLEKLANRLTQEGESYDCTRPSL